MDKLKLIIAREFIAKVRNKTFIIMTFLGPLLGVGMIALISTLTKNSIEKERTIMYLDHSSIFTKEDFKATKTLIFADVSDKSLEEAKIITKETGAYGLLYIPKESSIEDIAENMQFFSEESPSLIFTKNLESKLDKRLKLIKMQELNIDIDQVKKADINSNLHLNNFEGKESSKLKNELKLGIGSVSGYLLMMFIIIYGSLVMRSVIEEKTSRIIEVIVSSVKPFQLMLGKVLGTAGAGFLQFIIWVILAFALFSLLPLFGLTSSAELGPSQMEMLNNASQNNNFSLVMKEISNLPIMTILISFVFYFLGGFLLYSSLYAAIGAAVDNETDSQQFMFPIIMPLMIGIYVGFAVVINDPHGMLATTFSMIPFTSPVVMMMRIPMGAPLWQIVVSLTLLAITFVGVIWFAGKIYRVGILSYGKKPSYKDLWKWLKY